MRESARPCRSRSNRADGSGDIVIPDAVEFHFNATTGQYTLALWVYPKRFAGGQTLLDKWYAPDSYMLAVSGYQWTSVVDLAGGNVEVTAPTTVADLHEWHHLASTFDGSLLRLYVDGVDVMSKSGTGAISDSNMALHLGNHPGWSAFEGRLDDVRLYDRALLAAEIAALALVPASP
jgi:hypothetical protein